MNYAAKAASLYQRNGTEGDVACASPHRLIALMLSGVRRNVVAARQAIVDADIAGRGEATSAAIALLEELRASLQGQSELSGRLDALYEYMVSLLITANMRVNAESYGEVLSLLAPVEEAWSALPAQVAEDTALNESLQEYFHAEQ